MENIILGSNEFSEKAFILNDGEIKLGEMVISIEGTELTVYHTEIVPNAEGKGLGKILLQAMVTYAREHGLKIIPLCPFVHMQFKRHPENYADVWKRIEA